MPPDPRAAHERNDEVLERIYIGRRFRNDTERLEKLFELYAKMTAAAARAPAGGAKGRPRKVGKATADRTRARENATQDRHTRPGHPAGAVQAAWATRGLGAGSLDIRFRDATRAAGSIRRSRRRAHGLAPPWPAGHRRTILTADRLDVGLRVRSLRGIESAAAPLHTP